LYYVGLDVLLTTVLFFAGLYKLKFETPLAGRAVWVGGELKIEFILNQQKNLTAFAFYVFACATWQDTCLMFNALNTASMTTIDKSIEVLNDLIEINNDRVAGFTHATRELQEKELDVRNLFMELRNQSRENVHALGRAIHKSGGKVEMAMSGGATLHRVWLDLKCSFTGHSRKSILSECERGEDAIKKAYQVALSAGDIFPPEVRELVLQ